MKTKLFTLFILLFVFINTNAQAPKSFNYQAVVRNNNGNIIANQNVSFKISILQGTTTSAPVYIETHTAITDAIGLASLQIGDGTSLLSQFSLINWALGNYFIKIEVDPTGQNNYVLSNITKLLSVPYALYAENSNNTGWNKNANNIFNSNSGNVGIGTNSPNSKLEVKGSGDTLFQVKDNAGNPVFVVFPEGVRVFVKENAAGNLGGFAVSGRSASKATTYNDVFIVTPDSTRVYVNNNAKGNLGGFAVSGRSASKEISRNFMYLNPDNYFIGHESGLKNNGGLYNVYLGYKSGLNNNLGSYNIALGFQAGFNNTSSYNTITGYEAAYNNGGNSNTMYGYQCGYNNNEGNYNVLMGYQCGYNNVNGSSNVYLGYKSGYSNTTGTMNVLIGNESGYSNTTGFNNTFIGNNSGQFCKEGNNNIFIGTTAGFKANTSGNIYIGRSAGANNILGTSNIYLGHFSGGNDTSGSYNTFIGEYSGEENKNGYSNTYIGYYAGKTNMSGNSNTVIGNSAGSEMQGSGNILIGYNAGRKIKSNNKLYIHNGSDTIQPLIYGDISNDQIGFFKATNLNNPFTIGSSTYNGNGAYLTAGGVWTNGSSKSFKDRFTQITTNEILEKILTLDINGWYYKETNEFHIGPFAEEFYNTFGTGNKNSKEVDKYLAATDIAGVGLRGVQELIKENKLLNKEIDILKSKITELEKQQSSINQLKEEIEQLKQIIKK